MPDLFQELQAVSMSCLFFPLDFSVFALEASEDLKIS